MSYVESARRGEVLSTVRYAILNGSLWAIGISWSTAIRAVVAALLPDDTRDVIFGELLAAGITTVFAVGLSMAVAYDCCKRKPPDPPPPAPRVRRGTV